MAKKPTQAEPEAAPVAHEFGTRLNALVQATEQADQGLANVNRKMIALVLEAKKQDELAAAYIRAYRAIRDLEDTVTAKLKDIKAVVEEFKTQKLVEAFNDAQISTLTLESGDRVSLQDRVVAGIRSGKMEEAIKWAKKSKATKPLVIETINSSTLSAYAKTLLEANKSLPDDLFNVNVLTAASLTRGKKK